MKRKYVSIFMCLILSIGLCLPAFAADENLEEELTRVTLAVKNTLSIDNKYTSFTGDVDDMGALRYWSLNWSDETGNSIRVLATSAGKVMQYSSAAYVFDRPAYGGGFDPSFSKITTAQAEAVAKKFLGAVLTKGESAELTEKTSSPYVSLNGADYSFSAQILFGGVPSPNRAQLQVSAETGEIIYFSRDDSYSAYVNEVPSSVPAISAAAAAATMAGTVKLELQYVLPEGDGSAAVLRYIPTGGDEYYVDAKTGQLVNLTKAWEGLGNRAGGDKTSLSPEAGNEDSAKSGAGLSEEEQAAIKKLQGVMTQSALDAATRKVTALGLARYTLSSSQYDMDLKTGDVTCTLYYTRKLAYNELEGITSEQYNKGSFQHTKVLKLNAKTGELQAGWSYSPSDMKDIKTDRAKIQSAADSFLALRYPNYTGKVALTAGEGSEFRYDRIENGYFYHGNYVYIGIDPSDGSVSSFSSAWTDELSFQSPEGIVSTDAAKNAYCGVYSANLRYIAYPVAVNVSIPIWKTYAECCGYVAYRYELGYTYETNGVSVSGVDAKTGKPIIQTQQAPAVYTDISNSFAKKQIEALHAAGIGFSSGAEFKPSAVLTQKDMLALLLNSCGYSFDTDKLAGADELDYLYSAAWSQGFLTRGTRSPDHQVTRLEMVKSIIDASPYSQAAKLKGIFVTSFTDAAKIPADSLGYVAIAQGLGIIRGSGNGQFAPNTVVTRQTAAVILYNYMNSGS